jgi:hypothetical protein
MTALIVVAGILTGAFAGGCLAMAATFAAVSRSQERMQRKVRYWQAETTRVRAGAQAIAQTTAQAGGQLPDPEPLPDRHAQPVPDRPAQPVPDRPARARREPWVW